MGIHPRRLRKEETKIWGASGAPYFLIKITAYNRRIVNNIYYIGGFIMLDYIDMFLGVSTLIGAAIILIAALTVLVTVIYFVVHIRNVLVKKYYYKKFQKEWSERIVEAGKEAARKGA